MRSRFMVLTIVAASASSITILSGEGEAMSEDTTAPPPLTLAEDNPHQEPTATKIPTDEAAEVSADKTAREENLRSTASCPEGMMPVEGRYCYQNEQVCLQWDDPEGRPSGRVCAVFQEPTRCLSRTRMMRFCIDRNEFIEPGETVPMAGISWGEAKERCEAIEKRLCTSIEWEFACEGEEGLPYPYGYKRSPSLCNQDRVVRDGETKARGDLREPPHPSCVSPFGVRDMVGNVDEWVSRPFDKPRSELRGGWWTTGRNRCRAATTSHNERYADRQTGFRCCKDMTEP